MLLLSNPRISHFPKHNDSLCDASLTSFYTPSSSPVHPSIIKEISLSLVVISLRSSNFAVLDKNQQYNPIHHLHSHAVPSYDWCHASHPLTLALRSLQLKHQFKIGSPPWTTIQQSFSSLIQPIDIPKFINFCKHFIKASSKSCLSLQVGAKIIPVVAKVNAFWVFTKVNSSSAT